MTPRFPLSVREDILVFMCMSELIRGQEMVMIKGFSNLTKSVQQLTVADEASMSHMPYPHVCVCFFCLYIKLS